MPQNWKTYKFSELYDTSSGLSKSRDQFGFGYPFLTFKDVFYNYFLPDSLGDLANTNDKERFRGSIKIGDIFLTRTSETLHELGMSSVSLKDYPNATFNGFCKRLRLKEDIEIKIDPLFIGYYLRSMFFRNEVSAHATMTTRASLNNSSIASLHVTLPEIVEQKAIGNILKTLDNKIELNLQQNKTLEEMAMALYKHWFVDYGPFQDGEFVDSRLGMIPEGWEVKRLDEEFTITIGRTPPRKEPKWFSKTDGVKWISIKDMGNAGAYIFHTSEYLSNDAISSKNVPTIPKNTVILSFKLTVGRVCITTENMTTNEAIAHFVKTKKTTLSSEFIFLALKSFDYDSLGSTSSIATAVNSKTVKAMQIIVPNKSIIEEFQLKLSTQFELIKNNSAEIESLTKLRETLLPKLISGEVRLKDMENTLTEIL
jgi:type I restriction enzyme S subunit